MNQVCCRVLFLIAILGIILAAFTPAVFLLKYLVGFFAYGRSSAQVISFFIWLLVAVLASRWIRFPKGYEKYLWGVLLASLGFQLYLHFQLSQRLEVSFLSVVWPTDRGFTSVNSIAHLHTMKPSLGQLASLVGFSPEEYDFDSGYSMRWIFSSVEIGIGAIAIVGSALASIILFSLRSRTLSQKADVLLLAISLFGCFKLSIDGGVLNSTGVVWIGVLLTYFSPLSSPRKLGVIGSALLLLAAVVVAIKGQQSSFDGYDSISVFLGGVVLRLSLAFFILWQARPWWLKGTLALFTLVLSGYHPWVSGELVPFIERNRADHFSLAALPSTPWVKGDERELESFQISSEATELSKKQQKRDMVGVFTKPVATHRTVSAEVTFSPRRAVVSQFFKEQNGISWSLQPCRGLASCDAQIIAELPGGYPLSRGVQNSLQFLITKRIGERFIYHNERIWN